MKVIAGLGNPGNKYIFTRHNVGFLITSKLADNNNVSLKVESKFNAIVGKTTIGEEEVFIVQPQTFMNLSGDALLRLMSFYKIKPVDLIVVYDDISIDIGRIRFRGEGSDGGHNGIKSIIQNLGTNKFPRLKVGIGPQPKQLPSEAFVLQNFTSDDDKILDKVIELSVDALEYAVKNGVSNAQNIYNGVEIK